MAQTIVNGLPPEGGAQQALKSGGRLLEAGSTFRGYMVVGFIGSGGVGEVWLARHEVLNASFAVKVIPPKALDSDEEAKARFFREARIAARIRHPSLVAVYDAGRDEATGLYFLVMDLMSGGTVADRLLRVRKFSVRESVRIAREIAQGLVELHRNGIVHRDVKPLNMLFAADGSVKLSDPGIARESAPGVKTITQTGFALGTPLYMPYEQIVDSHAVDCRADVFALGVSLFEMLAGSCPDAELSAVAIFKRRMDGVRLPNLRTVNKSVPAPIAELVEQMTEPDANKRIPDAETVAKRLDLWLDPQGAAKKRRSRPGLPWILAAAGAGAALVLAVVGSAWHDGMIGFRTPAADDGTPPGGEPPEAQAVPVAAEVVREVVTQVVEKVEVQEVERYVVVTNFVKAEPPKARESVAAKAARTDAPAAEKAAGKVSACGVEIEYSASRAGDMERLADMLRKADAAVRRFAPAAEGRGGVRRIVLDAADRGDGRRREGKTLWIGSALAADDDSLAWLVAQLATPSKDDVREPFDQDLVYEHVRLRVYDRLRPGRGQKKIDEAIEKFHDMRLQYGDCDYNGQKTSYKTKIQRVPRSLVAEYRRGFVLELLNLAYKDTGGDSVGRYFKVKREAQEGQKLKRGKAMSASDFAAVLSLACGENFFPLLKSCGWDVDELATRLKLGPMKNAEFFGFGR